MPPLQRALPPLLREMSASRARLPPSPLLSARTRMATYLRATTMIIAQKIRLSTPNTLVASIASSWWPVKASRKA
jgi:hypothetical protein